MSRTIKIKFIAQVTVTQTIELNDDASHLNDGDIIDSLNGEQDTPICTSLTDGYVYEIDEGLKPIGRVIETEYDDGEYTDFEQVKEQDE